MRIPPERTIMTAAAYLDRAKVWTKALEDGEASRLGVRLSQARLSVARQTSIAPGTLENLRKGRLKTIAVDVYERLQAGVIRKLESELLHVQHELQVARQSGVDPRSGYFQSALASEARIREALGLDTPPASGGGE